MTAAPGRPPPERSDAPSRLLARRGFMLGGVAVLTAGAAGYGWWHNLGADLGAHALSVQQAHRFAQHGAGLLIDIRRPDEWALTGIGQGAVPLDMRRSDFILALLELTQGDKDQPIALICARGVRSRGMSKRLKEAGFRAVLDVPEGMLGSGAGPGWIRAGLPLRKP